MNKGWIAKVWRDPVWSKVISGLILAANSAVLVWALSGFSSNLSVILGKHTVRLDVVYQSRLDSLRTRATDADYICGHRLVADRGTTSRRGDDRGPWCEAAT